MPKDRKHKPAQDDLPAQHVIEDLGQARMLVDPVRLRILEDLIDEQRTTKQVAERLELPATRLYHHVEALEKVGLIRLVEERKKRGTTERYFRAIAKSFRASGELFADADTNPNDLAALAAAALENAAADLRALPTSSMDKSDTAYIASIEIQGDKAVIKRVERRIKRLLKDLVELSEQTAGDNGGESRKILIGLYPVVDSKKSEEESNEERDEAG